MTSFLFSCFLWVGQKKEVGLQGDLMRAPHYSHLLGPMLHSMAAVSQDYSAVWFYQMQQRHWMGTVWPWWADLRGISGAVVVDRQEQWEAVHTQLCVCVFHNALASGPSLALAPTLNHLSLPLTSQFAELSDCRQQELGNFWNDMKAFKETWVSLKDCGREVLRQTLYHLQVLTFFQWP